MRIIELYVENFGKLEKFKMSFRRGLNDFVEDNGYGKTTLTVFIKSMLFGIDTNKKHSLDENDRKRYSPWQGGAFGGWLSFEVGGKSYRVERTFGQKASDDTFTLINLDTGAVSHDIPDPIGESIFGIDADGFERTVFLSEKNISGKNNNDKIAAKLSNLVGTEGDIGGFDAAIKLLDDRRKFYQKRGGAGEIADTRREISDLEDEIRALKERRESAAELETKGAEIREKIANIKAEKEKHREIVRREQIEREKRGYELQYSEMLGSLRIDEKREEELLTFFGKKLPTNAEIAEAAEAEAEKKRLTAEIAESGESGELIALTEFFSSGVTAEECERAASLSARLEADKSELFSRGNQKSTESPFLRVPERDEISRHKAALERAPKKASFGSGILISIIGMLIASASFVLARSTSEVLYGISAIGVLLTIVGIIAIFKAKKNREIANLNSLARQFITEIYGERQFAAPTDALNTMSRELDEYTLKKESDRQRKYETEELMRTVEREEREIRNFLERFPSVDALTAEEAVTKINRKMQRYTLLLEYEGEKSDRLRQKNDRLKTINERLNAFYSCFPIATNDPIGEIRHALAEFDVLRSSLTRRRSEAQKFALAHGISTISIPQENAVGLDTGSASASKIAELDEELIAAERDRTALMADIAQLTRDVERIDELETRLLERGEAVRKYTENLSVITKAKDLLAVAKANMTARYIGPTKASFEKYVSLIDKELGDYTMDTSFTVTKTDLGKSRPEEAYSRGTRDLHSLAIRLALIDSLFGENTPPLILDDPFASFDDDRTERAIAVLKRLSEKRQIIYLTPSRSRRIK